MISLDKVLETEFSEDFVKKMRNRMIVSFYKYGPIATAYPNKLDAIKSSLARITKYHETSNMEYLVDAANFLMIEFMRPSKHDAFFRAEGSEQSPGRVDKDGVATKSTNSNI